MHKTYSARRDFSEPMRPEVSAFRQFVDDVTALIILPLAIAAMIVIAWACLLSLAAL